MKQTVGLAAILIASLAPLHAATTNSVQNILFELTFFAQGPTNQPSTDITQVSINKFRVTTRDIIAALGQATSNSFSSAARLVSVQDATSNGSERKIQVRDLGNIVDVTSFFKLAAVETNLLSVHSLVVNRATGIGTGMTDGIFHLTLTNANLATSLDLGGFATAKVAGIKSGGTVLSVDDISAAVAGYGTASNGTPAVVNGLVNIAGRVVKVE